MTILVDTSAFYALCSRSDENHETARSAYSRLLQADETLATTSYVLVETFALVQNRLGLTVLRKFVEAIDVHFQVVWIGEDAHKAAWKLLKSRPGGKLSFVDCTSFIVMEQEKLRAAFTFDKDFKKVGFNVVP